jgi:hypothetical protein
MNHSKIGGLLLLFSKPEFSGKMLFVVEGRGLMTIYEHTELVLSWGYSGHPWLL